MNNAVLLYSLTSLVIIPQGGVNVSLPESCNSLIRERKEPNLHPPNTFSLFDVIFLSAFFKLTMPHHFFTFAFLCMCRGVPVPRSGRRAAGGANVSPGNVYVMITPGVKAGYWMWTFLLGKVPRIPPWVMWCDRDSCQVILAPEALPCFEQKCGDRLAVPWQTGRKQISKLPAG